MGLSAADIAAVIQEIGPALMGGWIQKIFQPTPSSIVLEVRTPGQTLPLLLSADPDTARLHVISQKLPNPPSPPPFCQFLRAHVQGARIDAITQVPGDRIVRIGLMSREGPCTLVARLDRRNANLLLLDRDGKILAASDQKRDHVGTPYRLPSSRSPAGERDEVAPSPEPTPRSLFSISASLDQRHRQLEKELAARRAHRDLLTRLRKAIKRVTRRIDALQNDLEKAARYRDYARYGELLKTILHRIKKGDEQATVTDYFDRAQPELVIPLDPAKTPHGNMDDYFRKHRKFLAAEREIRPRITEAEQELAALCQEQRAVQEGEWIPPEQDSVPARGQHSRSSDRHSALRRAQGPEHGRGIPSTRHSKRSGPFRRFTSTDGLKIYVGKNARENDELTFKFAHGDDLWLHAQGVPGSHVVVRVEKGASPPPDTLKDAAMLALLYSDLKKSGKGEVLYTKRKYVRRMKGRHLGTVTVMRQESIFVSLDRIRLESIKERSGSSE